MFFGKRNETPPSPQETPESSNFDPKKAQKFFEHAATVDATGNYEYALQSWLSGMKQDPSSRIGVEGLFGSLGRFMNETGGKKGVSKEVERTVGGKSDLERYLASLLEWGQKPTEPSLAVRAMELGARLNLVEPVKWIGERAAAIVLRNPKPRKDLIVKVSESFEKVGVFDKAVSAAEAALRLDPVDGALAAKIRNLAAQSTMNKGGYEKAGQEGGFRQNIRDLDKQRQLEAQDRITKSSETVDSLIASAEKDYESRPHDLYAIEKYCKALLDRGQAADEERAHTVLTKTWEETKQFRFREMSGEIRLRQARRRYIDAKKHLETNPGDPAAQARHDKDYETWGTLEITEHKLRVENYPTDLVRKFLLGERYFAMNRYEEAIEMFQQSQGEPRYRGRSLSFLGQSFLKLEWASEAVDTFRSALDVRDLAPDTQLELQYFLMCALQAKAESDRDVAAVEEAEKLASTIAIKSISYRDIRLRRDAVKKLSQSLKSGGSAG